MSPGYADMDTRMLHGMFNMLVDFVEIEKAWRYVVFDKEEYKKCKHPWWSKSWTRFKAFRDIDAGIAYLKWEMTLDSPTLSTFDRNPAQASVAQEIWELYHWWKYVRPLREDPHDASGWSEYVGKMADNIWSNKQSADEKAKIGEMLDLANDITSSYDDQDQDMLIRLIKIRKHLWT